LKPNLIEFLEKYFFSDFQYCLSRLDFEASLFVFRKNLAAKSRKTEKPENAYTIQHTHFLYFSVFRCKIFAKNKERGFEIQTAQAILKIREKIFFKKFN
jgi:hypothetical protein